MQSKRRSWLQSSSISTFIYNNPQIDDCADSYKFGHQSPSTAAAPKQSPLLTFDERSQILLKNDSIPEAQKWKLQCNGKNVNDTMRAAAASAVYEHPVHSMILDPVDSIWNSRFTDEEMEEIKMYHPQELPDVPASLQTFLALYNKKWTTGLKLFDYADGLKYHPHQSV